MDLAILLQTEQNAIVGEAADRLTRAHLQHYAVSDSAENRARLQRLAELISDCVQQRNLIPMVDYAERLAEERFQGGFGVQEVLTAFNVMEETIWARITDAIEPADYPLAFGLLGTVLGAGKQALAVRYVSLAAKYQMPSLDLTSLFKGG